MSEAIVRLFVLAGFLLMALHITTAWGRRNPEHYSWTGWLASLSFGIALVLHIIGMVSP
jgi:hypothetical protein